MKRPVVLALVATVIFTALVAAIVAIFVPLATEGPPAEQAASFGSVGSGEIGWLAEPATVPAVTFSTGDGTMISLEDFAGRVVLLNFWATWCAPCVEEMPTLDRLQAELGGDRFEVVALSSDRAGAEAVDPFYDQHDLGNLALYLDPDGDVGRAFGIRGLPTTVLIDSQGREIARKEGAAEWDAPEIKTAIRSMTGQ